MIQFKNLKVRNFMAVGNGWMGYDFVNGKVFLVTGANGASKSSIILDGLTFALYGKAFRNVNKGEIINSINAKDCEAVVEFAIGKNEYKIERGIKPDYLRIYVNGTLRKSEARKHDYQKFLENTILRMDEKTFRQIVILGSSAYVPFMTLSAAARRVVVEDLLDLSIFTEMGKVAKEHLNALVSDSKTIEGQIKGLDTLAQETASLVDTLRSRDGQYVESKQEKIEKAEAEIENLKEQKDQAQKELSECLDEGEIRNIISTLQANMSKIISMGSKLESGIAAAQKENQFFHTHDVCHVCHQDIDETFKASKIEENESKISDLQAYVDQSKKEKEKVEAESKEQYEKLSHISDLNQNIKLWDHNIESNKSLVKMLTKDIQDHLDNSQQNLEQYETKLADTKANIAELKEKLQNLAIEGSRYNFVNEMLKDSGIKSKIIDTYLPLINYLVQSYLAIMEANIEFKFDNRFHETIKSRFRDDFSYASFSEGEKMRIDLCLLFAWREIARRRNSAATNLLIFDEIGDSSLDSEGFEAFMKILGKERENQCVIIISHSPEKIAGKCDRIYRYEKKNNFAHLAHYEEINEGGMSLT